MYQCEVSKLILTYHVNYPWIAHERVISASLTVLLSLIVNESEFVLFPARVLFLALFLSALFPFLLFWHVLDLYLSLFHVFVWLLPSVTLYSAFLFHDRLLHHPIEETKPALLH